MNNEKSQKIDKIKENSKENLLKKVEKTSIFDFMFSSIKSILDDFPDTNEYDNLKVNVLSSIKAKYDEEIAKIKFYNKSNFDEVFVKLKNSTEYIPEGLKIQI